MRSSIALGLAGLALLTPAAAQAADPETGYVDKDRLSQVWSGDSYGQPFKTAMLQEDCVSPFCDEFTLDVRHTGTLTILANVPDSAQYVDMEVLRPDGGADRIEGNETDDFAKIIYNKVPLGQYRVRVWANKLPALYEPGYTGSAKLVLPPPPPAPAQGQ